MKTKNSIVVVIVLVVLVAGAIIGHRKYADYVRDQADKKASECLRTYFRTAGDGSPNAVACEELKKVMAEMEAVSKKCSSEMANLLFERRLDGAFLIGDYAKAEAMMDELTGYTENWKAGAKAKIRGHAAQMAGDKATALKEFSVFVETLVKDETMKEEIDPCTGVAWTKEGLLARNKKRMAELAADIGQKAEAVKLRAEAKAHYLAAIAEAVENNDAEAKTELEKDAGDLLK